MDITDEQLERLDVIAGPAQTVGIRDFNIPDKTLAADIVVLLQSARQIIRELQSNRTARRSGLVGRDAAIDALQQLSNDYRPMGDDSHLIRIDTIDDAKEQIYRLP